MRARAYGLYPLKMAACLAAAQPRTVAVVSSNTFYAPWIALKLRLRGAPVVHWVLDLYPEALVAAGKLPADGGITRMLRRMMSQTFDLAAANVFLGEHLLRYAEESIGPVPRSIVIPIGADGAPFRAIVPLPRSKAKKPRVKMLYCGNMGHMHEVDTVATALEQGLPDGIEARFCGNGSGFVSLMKRVAGGMLKDRVFFSGNLPDAEWERVMGDADVALVTMSHKAAGVVMPSKAYSAMVAGQAILAVCPESSDLAVLVRKQNLGWIVRPGDCGGFIDVLNRISGNPEEVLQKRKNAWTTGHACYDQSIVSQDWIKLFNLVIEGRV